MIEGHYEGSVTFSCLEKQHLFIRGSSVLLTIKFKDRGCIVDSFNVCLVLLRKYTCVQNILERDLKM